MYCPVCKEELECIKSDRIGEGIYYCHNCFSQTKMNVRFNVDCDNGYEDDDYDLEYGVD